MKEFFGVSEQGLNLIRQYEGYSDKPYRCPAGKLTIGYGHVIGAEEMNDLNRLTLAQADTLLRKDASGVAAAISRLVTAPLSQTQGDALVSFVFNIGVAAFERSTMLRYLNQRKIKLAGAEFNRWVYSQGQKLAGLVKRREAEAALFSQQGLE